MKGAGLALAIAAAGVASTPGMGPGKWLAVVRQVAPDGAVTGRLTFERTPAGTRWSLRCYDTRGGRADVHAYDGVAPAEDEWVMGTTAGGHFTLALRGEPLFAAWLDGCPGMAEPEAIVRAPGSR
ncbi:hypothetical protein ABID82_004266 [Methylobacterium sp. PvP062]|uniref:Uncharacterized protein n=1 Tax=Methylobacterium radiotolerans TaxID=31998 RepID=A0ABV2NLB3_9HYPH|nr:MULTISPECIES: hypothetical protein [unclassified Methylobacterium]KZC01430.1 hypothetical protein AU375_02354 [Methylobacterium radiotolerans]MBP2496028.1 hypothetical protein [Methylobacterium sp. PvP105]MBP2504101.1 hypothetical protein [Methylobacterium sp. PvP109]MCX7333109.1 hypothetical protein [Hyphomicrobiales bacterium]